MLSFVGRALSAAAFVLFIAGCSGMQSAAIPSAGASAARPVVKETVLHNFASDGDGASPYAGLVNVSGTLYGTTIDGGANGYGTVFKITTSGKESVLHSFAGGTSDGANPYGGLIEVKGALYGTTLSAGGLGCYSTGCGAVFKITTSGKESLVYSFKGGAGDGAFPQAGLTDVKGALFGTTSEGGTKNYGTIFKIAASGKETLLHSFAGSADGATPIAGLIDFGGTLFGTTEVGGTGSCSGFQGAGCGTVFKVTTSGSEHVLFTFPGTTANGEFPFAGLTAVKGALYGTTVNGGSSNIGTVFKITPSGTESLVYSFKNSSGDGNEPYAGLLNIKGTLYGTTGQGGNASDGTVFKVTTSGAETVLYSFAGYPSNGGTPSAGLIDVNGTLYGTTDEGGNSSACYNNFGPVGCGTVFSLSL
ncbi:MAG TPA: choice-of-anchor tandem repeat GloVer-containing protein [Candidatus Cybelea sp.]|nr:choice-of-anchor tandem repeat GloVer-containing protein [Candidatus Cybelea sp.]